MAAPKKRMYLINRDFQLRYSAAAAVVGLLTTALTLIILLVPLRYFEIIRTAGFLPPGIFGIMIIAAAANIAMVCMLGIFITHRIAGPMYAIVRALRRIEIGRWAGHLKLRDSDDLRFVVRNFNEMVDGLVNTARKDLEYVEVALEKTSQDEAKESLNELKSRLQSRMQTKSDVGEEVPDDRTS